MRLSVIALFVPVAWIAIAAAQQSVPTEVQLPGTQPGEVTPPLPSWNCSFCHSYIDPAKEPWHLWQGSMMGHASSDPLFWATLAVAEQDFGGVGDLCLRCHVTPGWLAGRSTPTDGSGLFNTDLDGVTCEQCHKQVNPDDSEHIGVQNPPFLAHDGGTPKQAYRGNGMYVMWGGFERMGPYNDATTAPHGWLQSRFHRSADLCATCHDVSNPVVGDLAHNNGAQIPLPPGQFSGVLGSPVTTKAAFKNKPHEYGVVERTSSEHRASAIGDLQVEHFHQLPPELKAGAPRRTYEAALGTGNRGDYADGTDRLYTCQSCHMRPTVSVGCNMTGAPVRQDLPMHDLTGGNYWMGDALLWLESQGRLRVDYPFTPQQIQAIGDGSVRALETLAEAAALTVSGNTLRIVNRTGHKLITGYPEGRRLWVRTRWYDASGALVRTDGEYGALTVTLNGQPTQVETLLAPHDPKTHLIEANNGMTQQWAQQLLGFGLSPALPLAFDRVSGAVTQTLGGLAAAAPGTIWPTLHFALNNAQITDNRIPPYGFSYDEARTYNALPVPPTQFGNPGPGGTYNHWTDVPLSPPARAARAEIELVYQPTSWEYIQFLYLANNGANPNLSGTGQDMLDAWFATGMAAPEVIARAQWGAGRPEVYCTPKVNSLGCTPSIGWYGVPSASRDEGFQVVARNLRNNKPGVLLFSRGGRAATPFGGGVLCLANPIRRTVIETSGGRPTGNDCSGGLSVDFNAVIASGIDPGLVPGAVVDAQFWGRDNGFAPPNNMSLTDALEFVITP